MLSADKNKKKMVIFGSSGLLARECAMFFLPNFDLILLNHQQCDITDGVRVEKMLMENQPDVVINCAGIIDIDVCEKNPELAYKVNAAGAGNIARALKNNFSKIIFLQFSTCYVFGNEKTSYDEQDAPHPLNIYGQSKLAGERLIAEYLHDSDIFYFIVRTSWLYSEYRNTFVDLVVETLKKGEKIQVLIDQFNTVTWAKDLTAACEKFIVTTDFFSSGIYHISAQANPAPSRYEIALACAEICNLPAKLLAPIATETGFAQQRPASAWLISTKGIILSDWKESLRIYLLQKYG